VGADGAALVGENREGAHRTMLEVSPAALIPSVSRAAAFERAGARRRRSLARPAVDPTDEEGAAGNRGTPLISCSSFPVFATPEGTGRYLRARLEWRSFN
jgi:hypothetical protein